MQKRHRGVTMIELAVVLAIIAILATISLPSFIVLIETNRQKESVESMATVMRRAQAKAIEISSPVTVKIQQNLAYATGNGFIPFNVVFPPTIVPSGDLLVVFSPDGRVDSTKVITFNSTSTTNIPAKTVTITPVGQIITSN